MPIRNCKVCNQPIPEGRLKILPNTHTCVNHSDTSRYYVRPVINSDEDYSELEIIKDPEMIERVRDYESKAGHNGMMFNSAQ